HLQVIVDSDIHPCDRDQHSPTLSCPHSPRPHNFHYNHTDTIPTHKNSYHSPENALHLQFEPAMPPAPQSSLLPIPHPPTFIIPSDDDDDITEDSEVELELELDQ